MSSGAEGNDCGLAGKAASEYGINVPMKHTTLRCYGPGRALILPLIMPFGITTVTAHHHKFPTHKRELVTLYLIFGTLFFFDMFTNVTSDFYDS